MAIQPSLSARQRTRPTAPASAQGATRAPAPASARAATSWMKTGSAAREAGDMEIARQRDAQERRNSGTYMPFRFRTKAGEQREIIVLDAQPGPCFYEHNLQNPRTGKWDTFETCPKEWEPCPVCDGVAGGKESYYVMMLTCIDLTPWTNKKGEEVPYSKFLLPVKAQQQGFFLRQFDRHGTLRGLHLLMSRDTAQSASIGTPEFMELHSEEEILATFGHEAVTGQDGRVLKQKNADCFCYEYDKMFKKPSAEDLRRRYGGMAPAGSRQEQDDEWGDASATDASGAADDIPL